MEVGVHPGPQYGQGSQAIELCGVGVVAEGARYKNVESRLSSFPGRGGQIGLSHCPKLWPYEDARPFFGFSLRVFCLCADVFSGPTRRWS